MLSYQFTVFLLTYYDRLYKIVNDCNHIRVHDIEYIVADNQGRGSTVLLLTHDISEVRKAEKIGCWNVHWNILRCSRFFCPYCPNCTLADPRKIEIFVPLSPYPQDDKITTPSKPIVKSLFSVDFFNFCFFRSSLFCRPLPKIWRRYRAFYFCGTL